MLVTNGYRVLAAANGQEAIALFADNQVDLVLADHAMPQMSGDQLVLKLKQIASHVTMVILGDPQKMNGQIHGADALLAKNTCSPQELLERVKIMSARKTRSTQSAGFATGQCRTGCRVLDRSYRPNTFNSLNAWDPALLLGPMLPKSAISGI